MSTQNLNLEKIILKTIEIFSPMQIWLFGSFARGDFQEESDLNILVIVENGIGSKSRMHKSTELASVFDDICITPLVYTKDEVEKLKKIHHPLIESVFEEGEIIYEQEKES